jgi:peptidoglycan-associated lipoprotein
MNQKMTGLFIGIICAAFIAAGCAKKEVVKAEQPIAPPAKTVEAPAPAKPATPEAPAVKEETVQETVKEPVPAASLQTVYFDFDSYVLSAEARDTLKKNAEWIMQNPAAKVQVQGNCDERGSAEYNLALGENRAKAALKYLQTLGIPSDRLSYISYGKEKPVDPGHDDAAWAKNRRDDFALTK